MLNRTTPMNRSDAVVQQMTDQMARLTRMLSDWVQTEPRTLQEIEGQAVRVLHDLGTVLLTALVPLAAPARPAPDVPCPCGQTARYVRMRPATVTTVLGRVTLERAIYRCPTCGEYHAPLETQLQIAAGGLSLGLQELLALLGATQDSFAQAALVLERLCLVQVCPNRVRAATEDLGAALADHDQQVVTNTQTTGVPPPAEQAAALRMYLRLDGVFAHTHDDGWKDIKTGCISTTRTRVPRQRPDMLVIQAEQHSYVAALTDPATFGWRLWAEARRRGVTEQTELVALGDGAAWIWNLVAAHVPQATQILDWYHASQYVWRAAATIVGETNEVRTPWVRQQLDALWDGRVAAVLAVLEQSRARGAGVTDALGYCTTHQARMDDPAYRARGVQIGSGPIESAGKQRVSARRKRAGMIWDKEGAEAVAVVRAWLKSDRWAEAQRLRPPPRRADRRQAGGPDAAAAAA